MKEKLTKKEEALIPVVAREWINRLDSCPKLNRQACVDGILWLYKFSKLKEPVVMGVQSPLAAQFLASVIKANVRANVRDNVGANVGANVRANVGANVRDNVWDNVWDNVGDNVWDNVGANVWDNVGANVRDNVWDNVRANVRANVGANVRDNEFFSFSSHGGLYDFGWVAFYDYFERIGLDLKNEHFPKFRDLLKTGIYDCIQLDGLCIVCEMPQEIHRDDKMRLHSLNSPSIAWEDGYKLWHLWGTGFEEKLWADITTKKISAKEIIAIPNMEQRMAALKVIGVDNLIAEIGAKSVHKSDLGNELLEVKDIFPVTQYCLRYRCPSTGRIYISFVDPEVGKERDADKAMAWKFGLNKKDYQSIEMQS